jgi:hypothetical protein
VVHLEEVEIVLGSAGKQQAEVLCLLGFGGFQPSRILAAVLFLWFSCCIIVGDVADTLRQRDLGRQVAIGDSVSVHTMANRGTPRSLQVSAILCILF